MRLYILIPAMVLCFNLVACKKFSFSQLDSSATVTSYPNDNTMPPECYPPPGYDAGFGIAVIEGDPLIQGATCSGTSSNGLPDCTPVLRQKNLCGAVFRLIYNNNSVDGWFSGICPWNHPNNTAKGQWNPCAQGRHHVDLMQNLYDKLGLGPAQSWGPNGSTGQANPSAANIDIEYVTHIDGVDTVAH